MRSYRRVRRFESCRFVYSCDRFYMRVLTVTAFCVLFLLFLSGGHGELLSASIGVTAYGSVNMSSCVCLHVYLPAGMSVAGCIGNRAKSQCCPSCFFRESPSSIPECRMQDKMCSQVVRPMRMTAFGLLVRP